MTPAAEMLAADELMAQAGKTFYRAARLLPRPVRGDVVALYAFCRRVDDLADEPGLSTQERQRRLCDLAEAFERGSLGDLRAAGWPFPVQGATAEAARLLVRAAAGDLEQKQPANRRDLLDYAFGVAGTVGVMMADVLRAEPAGLRAAVALGIAMQLSNISRDIAEDFGNGRVYLPSEWVSASAVQKALHATGVEDAVSAGAVLDATGRVLALAERLYQAAFDGIWSLPWRLRWGILAAALCYREIGREVGRCGRLSWKRRVVVSGQRKALLIALAGFRLLWPRYWARRRDVAKPLPGQELLFAVSMLEAA